LDSPYLDHFIKLIYECRLMSFAWLLRLFCRGKRTCASRPIRNRDIDIFQMLLKIKFCVCGH